MLQARAFPQAISRSMLTSAVCRATHLTHLDALSWEWQRISTPLVATSKAVYLLTGSAIQGDHHQLWSLILKVLAPPADQHLPWEAYLYHSGFLASLTDGLIAPQCYGIDTLPDGSIALWLEVVRESRPSPWTGDHFNRAAQHLGAFSAQRSSSDASLMSRRVPCFTWHDLIDEWRENLTQLHAAADHALVQRAYPAATITGLIRLWEAQDPILNALAAAPQMLCHGDAQRRNLFVRELPTAAYTVAIDWANVSVRPIGNDIATLVHQALLYFDLDIASATASAQAVCAAFVEGLVAGGWRGTRSQVQLAFAAQVTLSSLSQIRPFLRLALNPGRHAWAEQFYGQPLDTIVERHRALGRFVIEQSHEVMNYLHQKR
jgi:Phosphotransferase enzyme family